MTPDSVLKLKTYPFTKLLVTLFSLTVALCLLIWSLHNYPPPSVIYGSRAIYSIIALSIILALLGRYLLLNMIKRESGMTHVLYHQLPPSWQTLFLFELTVPIYLAAGVLVGVPAAVLTALITQTCLQAYTYMRRFVSLAEAGYRIASTALVVLVADSVFTFISKTKPGQIVNGYSQLGESNELLGCILAAIVMLVLLLLTSLPSLMPSRDQRVNRSSQLDGPRAVSVPRWKVYVTSPALRFQGLVLSVGSLLPVVDIFDNTMAEVAWVFFLIPLFAIYYLALVSTRLSIRTDTL
ncbi:MAG TPA: hypothetical protein VJO32_01090, partial [Ktedonobacteraceae bacterium]|nr:hypothetical protein [Ktedonobacteraceae bacterium]